jgi:hypothetical protein
MIVNAVIYNSYVHQAAVARTTRLAALAAPQEGHEPIPVMVVKGKGGRKRALLNMLLMTLCILRNNVSLPLATFTLEYRKQRYPTYLLPWWAFRIASYYSRSFLCLAPFTGGSTTVTSVDFAGVETEDMEFIQEKLRSLVLCIPVVASCLKPRYFAG